MKEVIVLGNNTNVEIEGYRADEVALGSLPNINLWLEGDARCYNNETKKRFDRYAGEYTAASTSASSLNFEVRNKMLINKLASDTTDTTTAYDTLATTIPSIVPDEFTFVAVGRRLRSDKITYYAGGTFSNSTRKSLRIGTNDAGRLSWWGSEGSDLILSATSADIIAALTKPHVITATYSVANGAKLYLNGTLVAFNSSYNLVLDTRDLILFNTANLAQGHIMLFDQDYSQTESNLAKLHNTLKTYYSIA